MTTMLTITEEVRTRLAGEMRLPLSNVRVRQGTHPFKFIYDEKKRTILTPKLGGDYVMIGLIRARMLSGLYRAYGLAFLDFVVGHGNGETPQPVLNLFGDPNKDKTGKEYIVGVFKKPHDAYVSRLAQVSPEMDFAETFRMIAMRRLPPRATRSKEVNRKVAYMTNLISLVPSW